MLAFLGDIGAGRSSVLGDMLFVFNGGVLALAGFLLVWHTVAGTLDTAREGRFGFGAWEIVRIVAAVALMAPLPGGMNGAQHAVIGLAHLGGDFANAVWEPFSEEALGEGEPIAPRPREAVWRAAIARTLILEACRYAANGSAARAGDAPFIRTPRVPDEAYKSLAHPGPAHRCEDPALRRRRARHAGRPVRRDPLRRSRGRGRTRHRRRGAP